MTASGCCLQFFVPENRLVHGRAAYEWLLETARGLGIGGGSAYRGIAGYGRHGVLHENHFFELAGELPVLVMFALSREQADRLLQRLEREAVTFVYQRLPAELGTTGAGG